ncbi:unnamed protein product [Amoebophrya sp. A25]|nr:unnamed protein product [Amoebophrya sp. A25]|eukprot:GSA25T00018659001.1
MAKSRAVKAGATQAPMADTNEAGTAALAVRKKMKKKMSKKTKASNGKKDVATEGETAAAQSAVEKIVGSEAEEIFSEQKEEAMNDDGQQAVEAVAASSSTSVEVPTTLTQTIAFSEERNPERRVDLNSTKKLNVNAASLDTKAPLHAIEFGIVPNAQGSVLFGSSRWNGPRFIAAVYGPGHLTKNELPDGLRLEVQLNAPQACGQATRLREHLLKRYFLSSPTSSSTTSSTGNIINSAPALLRRTQGPIILTEEYPRQLVRLFIYPCHGPEASTSAHVLAPLVEETATLLNAATCAMLHAGIAMRTTPIAVGAQSPSGTLYTVDATSTPGCMQDGKPSTVGSVIIAEEDIVPTPSGSAVNAREKNRDQAQEEKQRKRAVVKNAQQVLDEIRLALAQHVEKRI